MARKRIGEVLLERGAITRAQLEEGLTYQRVSGQRLGAALVSLGALSEKQLAAALSEALGIERVDLSQVKVDWSAVHLLKVTFCELHHLFPFGVELTRGRKLLLVALSDPMNYAAIEEMEFITGLKVSARLASQNAIEGAIRRYYHKDETAEISDGLESEPEAEPVLELTTNDEVSPSARPSQSEREALTELLAAKERAVKERRAKTTGGAAVSDDLAFLGLPAEESEVEKLERRFWALMRLMAKKGLLTKEEFLQELDDD